MQRAACSFSLAQHVPAICFNTLMRFDDTNYEAPLASGANLFMKENCCNKTTSKNHRAKALRD